MLAKYWWCRICIYLNRICIYLDRILSPLLLLNSNCVCHVAPKKKSPKRIANLHKKFQCSDGTLCAGVKWKRKETMPSSAFDGILQIRKAKRWFHPERLPGLVFLGMLRYFSDRKMQFSRKC